MKKNVSVIKVLNIIFTIILMLIIAAVVYIFISRITGNVPSLFGYSIFRVQTDSMEPTLKVGDVILDKKVAPEDIKNGDIITYDCLIGRLAGQTITHRVVSDPEFRNGTYYYQTQGDIPGADPDPMVSYDQVEGKYVKSISWMNNIYSFFLSPYGLVTFIFIILLLFGYEMFRLVASYKTTEEKDDDYYAPKQKKPRKKRKK